MPDTTRSPARNQGIDLLRGLAILLVVIHHTSLRIPLAQTDAARVLPDMVIRALSWDGGRAVTLFFVISGFLITGHALRDGRGLGRIDMRGFYLRRAARILPCLLLLLAVLCILDGLGLDDFALFHTGQTLPGAVLSALTARLNLYETRTGYLPPNWDVLWSLSVEEAFYLAFPLVCLTLGRLPAVLPIATAALALSLPLVEHYLRDAPDIWQDVAYLPGFCAIATGVGAALLARRSPERLRSHAKTLGSLGLLGVSAYLLDARDVRHLLGSDLAPQFYTLACASLLLAVDTGWGRDAAMRLPRYVASWGRLSYEIYLSHMFVVLPAVDLFTRLGKPHALGWLWFPPILILSHALGLFVARAISIPADRHLRARFMPATP